MQLYHRTLSNAEYVELKPRHQCEEIQDWRDGERYTEMGVKDFGIGSDLETICNIFKDHGGRLVEFLGRDYPEGGKPLPITSDTR